MALSRLAVPLSLDPKFNENSTRFDLAQLAEIKADRDDFYVVRDDCGSLTTRSDGTERVLHRDETLMVAGCAVDVEQFTPVGQRVTVNAKTLLALFSILNYFGFLNQYVDFSG